MFRELSNETTQRMMDAEISKRMESPQWDLDIAQKVLSRRKKTKRKGLMAAFLTSFAACILLLPPFIFHTGEKPVKAEFGTFISTQVNGTYKQVFAVRSVNNFSDTLSYGGIPADPTDDLIDSVLAMR